MQGGGKYGFYEVFKYLYGEQLFPDMNKTAVFLGASASAEFLADIALCPFESIKVRMQTTLPPFASTLREGMSKVIKEEGVAGYVSARKSTELGRKNTDFMAVDFTRDSTHYGRDKSHTPW